MPNGPGPVPPRYASASIVAPPPPTGGGEAAVVAPSGSAHILALQQLSSGYALLVTASEGAWISCKVSGAGVDLATGESWIPKDQKVTITLTTLVILPHAPTSYDASCIPQFLTPAGTAAQTTFDPAAVIPPISTYSLSPEPAAVTILSTDADWQPSFSVSVPGTLTMVLDDTVPGLTPTIDTDPVPPGSSRKMKQPILTSALEEGKYYRYHFTGAAGSAVLVQQNKTYLLYSKRTYVVQEHHSSTSYSHRTD
jgi:hypothetical protein